MNVLALNAGSTSLKFRFGSLGGPPLVQGTARAFGGPGAELKIFDTSGALVASDAPATLLDAARIVLQFLKSGGAPPDAIGHRFVHGGSELLSHSLLDPAVRSQLERACAFAPLHNPPALAALACAEQCFPGVAHVACLDTAFHATMPEASTRFPLPLGRLQGGLRRYGFHGLSCESVLRQLSGAPSRLVIAHLGGGASVTAIRDGRSVDTTMGLTPDGGVIMETRSGDLDPGLLIYLLRHGETADSLEKLLNMSSGLLGISGKTGDLRDLRTSADPAAKLAIAMFATAIAKAIAAMTVTLGGLDMMLFTGGIGEHDGQMRDSIAAQIACIARPAIMVVPADEEGEIIRHTVRIRRLS
jgi:acetate kinase